MALTSTSMVQFAKSLGWQWVCVPILCHLCVIQHSLHLMVVRINGKLAIFLTAAHTKQWFKDRDHVDSEFREK